MTGSWKYYGVGLGALLFLCVFSTRSAEAQSSWGISLEATDGCCESQPEFAPPPPPMRSPSYRYQRPYRLRYRRRYPSYYGKKKPQVGFELGHSRIWIQPDSGQLSWDLNLLQFWVESEVKRGLWMGSGMRLGHLEGTRWPLELSKGDFWLNTRHWLEMDMTVGYHFWYLRTGWLGYREIQWGLPDATARKMAQTNGKADAVRNTLGGLGPNWMLPYIATGFRLGPVRLEGGAALHSWDFRSYRLHTSLVVAKWGLGVRLTGAYQADGVRLRMEGEKDTDPNELAQALWTRRFWEISMAATADLSSLFGWNKNRWVGPLQLMVGVRYRNILEHSLQSLQDTTLFQEHPGSQWAFFAGVQIAFGQGQHPTLY